MKIKNSLVLMAFFLVAGCNTSVLGPKKDLTLTVSPKQEGNLITASVILEGNPGNIDAFGFKCKYTPHCLDYIIVDSTDCLTSGWLMLGGKENERGVITVGGINLAPAKEDGTLIKLIFTKDLPGEAIISIVDVYDDLMGAYLVTGSITVK